MHQSNGVKHSSHSSHNAASRSNETQETNVRSFQLQWWSIIIHRLPILLRLVSCLCLVAGLLVSNWVLHTHEECDMTYSRRQFLPLSMNTTNTSHSSQSQYRFWKFIDQRDPRYRRFVTSSANGDSDKSLTGTDWCNNNNNNNTTVAVLYIPGHGGSYEQSRSLGAHGLQLTSARDMRQQRRVVSALQRNEWSGATDSDNTDSGNTDNGNTDKGNKEDSFIFDVYAVDFGEEGGAFHGDLILEQGRFVGEAVLKLVQDCHLPSIVLVAHSMGGFSARLASILVPETRPHIRNIVTLGTPHAGAWNPSLYHLQEHMNMNMNGNYNDNDKDTSVQDNTAMISIAGGLRDEMILPEACHVHTSSATTIMATDMMKATSSGRQPDLGMDHRAIAWCHNLLLSVRTVIFTLVQTDRKNLPATDRVAAVLESLSIDSTKYDFLSSAKELRTTFRRLYGTAQAMLMEAALLYNVELLITLYAYIGAWRCIISSSTASWAPAVSMLLPLFATVHCRLFIESMVPLHSIVLLAYVADAIFLLLRLILLYSVRGVWVAGHRAVTGALRRLSFSFILTACVLQLVHVVIGFAEKRQIELLDGQPLLALASFAFSPVLALTFVAGFSRQTSGCDPQIDRYVDGVAWSMPLVPLILAGEIYYIFVRGKTSSTLGAALVWKVLPVVLGLILGYVAIINPVREKAVRRATSTVLQVVRVCLVVVASPLIFKSGGSFYIGHMLVAVSIVDDIETIACLPARTNFPGKKE